MTNLADLADLAVIADSGLVPNYDYCLIGYIGFKTEIYGYLLNFKVKVLFPGFLLEKTEFCLTYQTKPKAVKHLLKQNWKSPLALTVLQYTRFRKKFLL